jgi:acetyl-CoA carboxylase biotin carboxyl carrier protein
MDLDQLKQILNLVREHELSEFEIEHEGLRLKIRKDPTGSIVMMPGAANQTVPLATPAATPARSGSASPTQGPTLTEGEAADEDIELAVVKSPIVGTFYRSPEPSAPPFVEIGSVVKKGQVLCIIEAMKLMNEIDSECDGEIVNVYVETGQPVQYGERLFAIRTR